MKTRPSTSIAYRWQGLFSVLALAMLAGSAHGVVGYVNLEIKPGENLVANPLWPNTAPNNDCSLSTILPTVPAGTIVSLWNPATLSFTQTSTFVDGSGWSTNLQLLPGVGAKFTNPGTSPFTATFVGEVGNFDGTRPADIDHLYDHPPTPFAGPAGTYLLASKVPIALTGDDVFRYVLGRVPKPGEHFTWLNSSTQVYSTVIYDELDLTWHPAPPSLSVGQAAFYTIVPEPASLSLLALGGLAMLRRRR